MNKLFAVLFGFLALFFAPLAQAQYVPPPKGSVPDFVNQGYIGTSLSTSMTPVNISSTAYNKNGWTTTSTCVNIPAGSYYVTGIVSAISNLAGLNELQARIKLSSYGSIPNSESFAYMDTQNRGAVSVMAYFTIMSSDCVGLEAANRATTATASTMSLAVWKK